MSSAKTKQPNVPHKRPENPYLPKNNDRFYGLINQCNICYSNSVIQLLYFCTPFRDCVNNYPKKRLLPIETQKTLIGYDPEEHQKNLNAQAASSKANVNANGTDVSLSPSKDAIAAGLGMSGQELMDSDLIPEPYSMEINSNQKYNIPQTMFTALKDLFWHISTRVARAGTYNPSKFNTCLKQNNALFRNNYHQDAHEMLNYLLNEIAENVENIQISKNLTTGTGRSYDDSDPFTGATWIHTLFQGLLTNETKCLTCENVTNRDEAFLDLSVDIEDNTSVTNCLKQFAAGEILSQKNKFYCDKCGALQEAERRMRLKRLPNILALHLKRFKYNENIGNYIKLNYRVNYPLNLRVPGTTFDAEDIEYKLVGAIVHLGSGLSQGHYIVIVQSEEKWIIFDDDYVDVVHESDLELYFGDSLTYGGIYVLLYERLDFDPSKYDLPGQDPPQKTKIPESPPQPDTTNLKTAKSGYKTSGSDDALGIQDDNKNPGETAAQVNLESIKASSSEASSTQLLPQPQPQPQPLPQPLPLLGDTSAPKAHSDATVAETHKPAPIPIAIAIPMAQRKNDDIPSHSYQEINESSSSVLTNIIEYHSSFDTRESIPRPDGNHFDPEINVRLPPAQAQNPNGADLQKSESGKASEGSKSALKSKTWKLFGKNKDSDKDKDKG